MLPATKACLQGFREFLKCYRSATEVLPGATKAGALGIFDFWFLSFDLVKGGGRDTNKHEFL